MKAIYGVVIFPLLLNYMAYYMDLDYMVSVNVVLGTMTVMLLLNGIRVMTRNDWKLFWGISLFSNIFTLFVEVIMLKFDVWSFDDSQVRLLGVTLFGAPIEEYVFWMYCPWLVGACYITLARGAINSTVNLSYVSVVANRMKILEDKMKSLVADRVSYTKGDNGKYNRGKKIPVYLSVQIIMVAMILFLYKGYKGSLTAMLLTTVMFFFTMMPYEQYAISKGFWVYNESRVIGLFILKVPFEGWLMYIIPPIAGSMITDYCSRKFFKTNL